MGSGFEFQHHGAGWVHVTGEGVPPGLRLQIAARGERLHVVAVYLQNMGAPIASSDLRKIPLSTITSALWSDLLHQKRRAERIKIEAFIRLGDAHASPLDSDLELPPGQAEHLRSAQTAFLQSHDHERALAEKIAAIAELGEVLEPAVFDHRTPGAAPATDAELEAFAAEYLAQIRQGMRGSITRTARARSVSRSTVYRWIDACREKGLLPSDTEENS